MTISKDLKKLFVAGAALLMVASTGVGMNNVNAKRRYRYHYRTHRVYRRHARRRYRVRRRARRHARRYRSRVRLTGMSARHQTGGSYQYHISNPSLLKAMANQLGISESRLMNKYSSNGRTVNAYDIGGYLQPTKIAKQTARQNGMSLASMIRHGSFEEGTDVSRGPINAYNLGGYIMLYTPTQLKEYATSNHVSVPKALKLYTRHATKYWDASGNATPLGLKEAERDALNDLNQKRAAQGGNVMTMDPNLEELAEKRAQLMDKNWNGSNLNFHIDPYHDQTYNTEVAQKYNIPYDGGDFENVAPGGIPQIDSFEKPSQIAKQENNIWDSSHIENRMGSNYTRAGIGISKEGSIAEEFD